MTTRIEREFEFQAGVYFKEEFLMNLYTITLYMEVETESIREQNVAMERIKYFLNECLENGIFVQDTEHKVIEKYSTCVLTSIELLNNIIRKSYANIEFVFY